MKEMKDREGRSGERKREKARKLFIFSTESFHLRSM